MNEKSKNVIFYRILVLLAMIFGFCVLQLTYLSTNEPLYEHTRKYIYENLGTTFLAGYIVLGMFLAWKHSQYWPFLSKVERRLLDERQVDIRERVFERSYRALASLVLVTVIIFNSTNNRMHAVLLWFNIASFFLLPVFIAAWRKDS